MTLTDVHAQEPVSADTAKTLPAPTVTGDPVAGSVSPARKFVAESPQVLERVITAPAAGAFSLLPTAEGQSVEAGQVVGTIDRNSGQMDVVSPHTGFLMGLLALPGERVRPQQPLAWVRVLA